MAMLTVRMILPRFVMMPSFGDIKWLPSPAHLPSSDRFNFSTFTRGYPGTQGSPFRVRLDLRQNILFADAACLRDASRLQQGVPDADVGIQAAGRGRHGIGRNGGVGERPFSVR